MTIASLPDTEAERTDEPGALTDGIHLVVDALKLNDVNTIYGVVGIPITDLARLAQASGIRYIGFRHESDAGHAAAAAGFLTKASSFTDILAAIRNPAVGKMVIEGTTLRALREELGSVELEHGGGPTALGAPEGREPDWSRLTGREREVLALMGEGFDPTAIAQRLVVSVHTARGHVKNVMMKLGAHSQLEAVVVATRSGLLSSDGVGSAPRTH